MAAPDSPAMEHDDHTFSTDSAAGGLMSGRYVFLTTPRALQCPDAQRDVTLYRSSAAQFQIAPAGGRGPGFPARHRPALPSRDAGPSPVEAGGNHLDDNEVVRTRRLIT